MPAVSGADSTVVRQAVTAAGRSAVEDGYWKHFAPGDRVLVFGEPDPVTGSRRVRRGTVHEPPSPEIIRIDFGDEGHREFSPADPVRVNHVAGTCPCVVTL